MKQIKPSLSINLDLIKEGELRYFFRPFFWKTMDYSILWEEKTPVPISSINLKTTHEHIIEEMPAPAVKAISISTVEKTVPKPAVEVISVPTVETTVPTSTVEVISTSSVEEIPTPSITNKETISENLEEKPQTQEKDVVSSTNDILASYRNIAKRYKS